MGSSAKRQRWYREGSDVCARVFGDRRYRCPICLNAFDEESAARDLTLEHAPPRCVGGKEVALTCRSCNGAGAKLDANYERHRAWLSFIVGKSVRPVPALVNVAGHEIRSEATFDGEQLEFAGVLKQNDERVIDRQVAVLDGWVGENPPTEEPTFRVQVSEKADENLAKLAAMRAAYVLMFAAIGYRYVIRPELEPLRRLLVDPSRGPSFPLTAALAPQGNPTESFMVVVTDPAGWGVLVDLGLYAVFLPGPDPDPAFFERTAERLETGLGHEQMTGHPIPWPLQPEYRLDRESTP